MTLQPVPTELCSQLDEVVAEKKMGHFLPASTPAEGLPFCAEAVSVAQPVCACQAGALGCPALVVAAPVEHPLAF